VKLLVPVIATLFLASVSSAYAANASGKIRSIDMSRDVVTLDKGAAFVAPSTTQLSKFKVGEKVSVSYMTKAGKKEISAMKPAA
jgi:Cu/Ag efflux protein CusF